jgi:diguanylate cyclase
MKARFSPLRIRLLLFGAIAFTILALGTTIVTLTIIRKSAELNYELKRLSDVQLVKLYLETSLPGAWAEKGGYLYKGEERLTFGPTIREALSDYLSPDVSILFGAGPSPSRLPSLDKIVILDEPHPEFPPPEPSPAQAKGRAPKHPDHPFPTALGVCVEVKGAMGEPVGWIIVTGWEKQWSMRGHWFMQWFLILVGAVNLLMIIVFREVLLRLTRPIDAITEEHEVAMVKNVELANRSRTDPLTKLLNRRGLEEFLAEAEPDIPPLSHVAMLDVDHFKLVNDERGHEEGDRVLAAVAVAAAAQVRAGDQCCRWGGEEFIILFRGLSDGHAAATAERIRGAIEACRFGTEEFPLRVTVTIGIAVAEGLRFHDAVALADRAMYKGKREGRNRVIVA